MTAQQQLIVFTGLPGTGKSSLAEAVGRELSVPVFAKDWLEAALLLSGFDGKGESASRLGFMGYELLTTLARRQLQLGQSAILDSVASTETIRDQWRQLAATYAACWCVVECVCSDATIHRDRLLTRQRQIPGWHELTWSEVERVRAYYVSWRDERLTLDMLNPLDENIESALSYLKSGNCSDP